ncbi:MarR family transcriptional regulator [Trinickia caryophylli]|uniref:Transcriptional regulator, MarR family n=1 Tax=Trinickia caryophylli TaxID=28094 RepID=A0A1X7CIU4_TRICW|nr:MarR family transcriptional regulator [Trinickia caryophylli]PMS11512.1 MarR family transcriptional regulator [Trinickia caryophylli]TRX19936.1 MarR family transcriptional regulator [Trinickia caryophylli]WQE12727.1 MarR family transcriptional regulator [Trinickia caryophylli]SME97377.1 transcriptional regulator, MarR family [Trinickia caryophylli]GLU30434.1 MarR family transcriptional regulator [Trinickia caryophylli]
MSIRPAPNTPPSDSIVPADQAPLLDFLGYHVRRAYLTVQADFDACIQKLDLRQTEFGVMSILCANPGINQKTLAEALAIAPPNLAMLLDRLENRKLLKRRRSMEDKRVQLVSLTQQGTRLYDKALEAAREADQRSASKLTRAEIDQLKVLLGKMFAR